MAENKTQPAATTPLVNNARTGDVGVGQSLKDANGNNTLLEKYNINNAIYPIDLFDSRGIYGDNYVVFYINVPESSKLFSERKIEPQNRDTTEIGSTLAKNNSQISREAASSITGGVLGAGVGGMLGGKRGSAIGSVTGAAAGYATAGMLPNRQNKRIKDTITLNIPNSLVARYSASWDAEDMVLASAATDITNALTNKNSSQSVSDTGKAVLTNLGLSKVPGGGIAQAMSGVAPNPKKEQLFRNVDFRTFNFEYQFAPRNAKESQQVKNIIDLFKLHMHPEFKDTAGFLFLYPSEFEIVYYQGDSENMNLPRHTSSVLIDMSVNYTPQTMFNTFENGASTLITINLTFKELAILTKAEILDGF